MIEQIYFCDKCAAEIGNTRLEPVLNLIARSTLTVWVDRKMDGAGSMEDEYETILLCQCCMNRALLEFLKQQDTIFIREWVRRFTTGKFDVKH
jgi:hypothetical protein